MSDTTNINNYTYDSENIAKSLKQAMSMNADPLVVNYLNEARKNKIKNSGGSLVQYENDELTKAADDYVDIYREPGVSRLHEARRQAQADALKAAHQAAKSGYEHGAADVAGEYSDARRLYLADTQKKQLDTEAALARLGLGKGVVKNASSGFGESARAKLLSDAAEGMHKLYRDEQAAKGKLAADMQNAMAQASDKYMENTDEAYRDQAADALSADNNFKENRVKLLELNNKLRESERDFNYKKETDDRNFALNERELDYKIADSKRSYNLNVQKAEYEKAFDTFEKVGMVTSEEQAKILGLPVGTTTESVNRFIHEIASEDRKYELDMRKNEFGEAYDIFVKTGKVTSQEQADILGIPVGTTTLDSEKLAYDKAYSEREFASELEKELFDRAYSVFTATGSVTSQEQADILGINVGTKYWKYVHDSMRANASVTNANTAATNANTAAKRAATSAYKSQTERIKVENQIANDEAKRAREEDPYGYKKEKEEQKQ